MEACYGGTDVMERSCAVARGIDINNSDVGVGVFDWFYFSSASGSELPGGVCLGLSLRYRHWHHTCTCIIILPTQFSIPIQRHPAPVRTALVFYLYRYRSTTTYNIYNIILILYTVHSAAHAA
jgi:hypothetical protein